MTEQSLAQRWTRLLDLLEDELPAAVDLRHRIHADPHVSGEEGPTAQLVAEALGSPEAPDIHGGRAIRLGVPGPAVALRAELDALPIPERTGVDWASTNGTMHACGHDVHMAALVAVARVLSCSDERIPAVLLLQPREEVAPGGAEDIVASGVLQDNDVRAVIGVHVQPRLTKGSFSAAPGIVNASADEFTISVQGTPGHGAYPHTTHDPVVAAAHIVTTVQFVISRFSDPMEPSVITVGSIHGGTAPNAIAESVVISGTVRAYDGDQRIHLQKALAQVAQQTAAIHGCTAAVDLRLGEPALMNDPDLAARVCRWLSFDSLTEAPPMRSCGADDFAHYGEILPSLMAFVGVSPIDSTEERLHSPTFLPDDATIRDVAAVMLAGYLSASEMIDAHT